jgi:hypothetical protein
MITIVECVDDSKIFAYSHSSPVVKGQQYLAEWEPEGLKGHLRIVGRIDMGVPREWVNYSRLTLDDGTLFFSTKPMLLLSNRFKEIV